MRGNPEIMDKPAASFGFLKHNGKWFKVVLILSILIRLYLVIFTQGTYDVSIWERHASIIDKIGLIEYYKASYGNIRVFNHPPPIGYVVEGIYLLSKFIHIPFGVIFRLLFTSLDFITAFYLFRILGTSSYKYIYTALYLLNPITFIFSAYHGNTDSSLGLGILMAVYYLSKKKYAVAGLILGMTGWVKWIALAAAPILLFAPAQWRGRVRFAISAGLTFMIGYFWIFVQSPGVLIDSVFRYGGQTIHTIAGIPVWGNRIIFIKLAEIYLRFFNYPTAECFGRWIDWFVMHNNTAIFIVIVAYAWLQRHRKTGPEIARTIAEVFCIFYGMTNFWSFQYLAWSVPFWVFLGLPLFTAISFFLSCYIYLLYSLVCSSWLFLGKWDFVGHPYLSGPVIFFRNMSVLLFACCAVYFFSGALAACFRKTLDGNRRQR